MPDSNIGELPSLSPLLTSLVPIWDPTAVGDEKTKAASLSEILALGSFASTLSIISASENSTSIAGNTFTKIPLNTINSDVGGRWSAANQAYTVPSTGIYIGVSNLRLNDGFQLVSYGQGIHSSLSDGSHFRWQNTESGSANNRNGSQNFRIFSATQGQTFFPYAFISVAGTHAISNAQFVMFRLF
jgi:hypothetical protein